MTLLELKALLARITYKPGMRVIVMEPNRHGDIGIQMIHYVRDACASSTKQELVPITCNLTLAGLDQLPAQYVLLFLTRSIRDFEQHEVDEWLKLDGQCINDPHPELKRERVA